MKVAKNDEPRLVVQTGPEPRPFPALVALDAVRLAEDIYKMLLL